MPTKAERHVLYLVVIIDNLETQDGRIIVENRAGTSLEWDFDGNVEPGVVGLHVPPVLVPELLKDLAYLRLVGEKTGARGERLPSGGQGR